MNELPFTAKSAILKGHLSKEVRIDSTHSR